MEAGYMGLFVLTLSFLTAFSSRYLSPSNHTIIPQLSAYYISGQWLSMPVYKLLDHLRRQRT